MGTVLSSEELVTRKFGKIESLPILVLHVHSRCNCRCLMCDIWQRDGDSSARAIDLERHRQDLKALGVKQVALTGGEPLLNKDLGAICNFFKDLGIFVTVITTGLLLKSRADILALYADEIIVSLDGPREAHDGVRRVAGAFDLIAAGIAEVRRISPKKRITARCTIQRANFNHLLETVLSARMLAMNEISFLAVDVSSTAFNRPLLWPVERKSGVSLTSAEVDLLDAEMARVIDFGKAAGNLGFVAESADKLRRIARTFRVYTNEVSARSPRCNAPWVSIVWELDGTVRPCFFHASIGNTSHGSLREAINSPAAQKFRESLDVTTNATCQNCVCSLNYQPTRLDAAS